MSEPVIVAGFALSRCFRAAARAAESARSTEWARREREAIDAVRAAGLFLGYHAGTPVARAITRTFTEYSGTIQDNEANRPVASPVTPTPGERDAVAQIHTVRLVDDLTGGQAAETIPFALDGTQYEIDLCEANASALRAALAPFAAAARSSSPSPRSEQTSRRGHSTAATTTTARQHNQAMRAWARQNGYTVAERGRIPTEIASAYHAAKHTPTAPNRAAVQFSG